MCVQYFTNKDPDSLSMSGSYNDNGDGLTEWYQSTPGVECYVGDKALKIDREAKTVISESGRVSRSSHDIMPQRWSFPGLGFV